jgi:ribosomal protein S27AE
MKTDFEWETLKIDKYCPSCGLKKTGGLPVVDWIDRVRFLFHSCPNCGHTWESPPEELPEDFGCSRTPKENHR